MHQTLTLGLTVALLLAEILNVVQHFVSPQPKLLLFVTVVTVVQWSASRKCQKTRVKPENTWVFPRVFSGIIPALDAGDRRVGHCQAFLTVVQSA